jgi:hypothetical protein
MPLRPYLLLLTLCLGLAGCGRIQRIRECRALVASVNPALGGVQQHLVTNRHDAAFYGEVAGRYDALALDLGKLSFANPQLKVLVDEYRSVMTSAAQAVRSVGLAQTNPQALPQARLELDRVVRREKISVLKIDAECHAP